jgi:hypothetical protein
MDNIVNYVRAGRSIVLKFEVLACSEEKTSTDNMVPFGYGIVYLGLNYLCYTTRQDEKPWPYMNHFLWPVMRCKCIRLIRAKITHKLIPDKPAIYHQVACHHPQPT